MEKLFQLTTEESNPKSAHLDEMTTQEILQTMNDEDATIAQAVRNELPVIEQVVNRIVQAFREGGRLFYVGAGTSGRVGILDAVECPPTFSTDPHLVQAVMAGGHEAMFRAVEGAEDDERLGAADLQASQIAAADVVIGIAASGRTPYVKGALIYANAQGATTVALTSNKGSILGTVADLAIEVVTGPEVLTGSTRLRAATAHKMVLNMLTTTAMVKSGKAYNNLMIDVNASNFKLRERAKQMVMTVTGVEYEQAETILRLTNYDVKVAIVMQFAQVDAGEAQLALTNAKGFVREAIRNLSHAEGV